MLGGVNASRRCSRVYFHLASGGDWQWCAQQHAGCLHITTTTQRTPRMLKVPFYYALSFFLFLGWRLNVITSNPRDCPLPLPAYMMADQLVGKNDLPFLWAGLPYQTNQSQQENIFDFNGTHSVRISSEGSELFLSFFIFGFGWLSHGVPSLQCTTAYDWWTVQG